jgi:hypothetical protein
MRRVAILHGKQKFEIVIGGIDKSDKPCAIYLDAEANCRTVLMNVEVARVCVRSRR